MSDKKNKKSPSDISIRWKLASYFAVFVAICLFIVGCLQILLLEFFFEQTKKKALTETADEISRLLNSETLEMEALSLSAERNMSILVYRIEDGKAVNVVNTTANGKHSGFLMEQETLATLYGKALRNGGSYQTKITFGGSEINDRIGFFGNVHYDEKTHEYVKIPSQNIRIVQVNATERADGTPCVIFLHTSLLPLELTVFTLRVQFNWIAAIMTVLALVMVLLLYRKISRPLIQMNEAAKQLAQGKYDASFMGEGFLETKELAQTLNYASEELSKSDRLQKDLIANISHDLRTPLTMIRGYTEMMRDIPNENTPENLQLVIDETDRLSALVTDLLDLSKIQSGARMPAYELFDLNAATDEVMQRYEAFTKHQGYTVDWRGGQEAFVYADRNMILQVIYNMTNNAINYTGEDKHVIVSQQIERGKVRMCFTDTGEGIPQEQVALIWDRYYKIDTVHRRAMVGTGLGLSIVKEILQKHGAAYGVSSTIGEGSTFWFELTLCQPPTQILNNDEKDRLM